MPAIISTSPRPAPQPRAFSSVRADGGFKSYSLSLFGSHSLSGDLLKGLSLFAAGSYTRLRGGLRRSLIVSVAGSPNQWFGVIGLAYTFQSAPVG